MQAAPEKPLLRGHFHQAAFFIAVGALAVLFSQCSNFLQSITIFIYAIGLCGMFGVSALYHRPKWSPHMRMWMRRFDHAVIYLCIAGTGTPICLLGLQGEPGNKLLILLWISALLGVGQSLFWVNAPKWLSAFFYVVVGCLSVPYLTDINTGLGAHNAYLILVGGAAYISGAVIYALKKPNPAPKVFGYHELFHLLVMVGAFFHFMAVSSLIP